jgi:hypothetical protein
VLAVWAFEAVFGRKEMAIHREMSKPTGTPDAPRAVDAGMEDEKAMQAAMDDMVFAGGDRDSWEFGFEAGWAKRGERTAEILRTLLGTAYCGTGVVPVNTSGFASLRTTAVVKQEDIMRVFAKFGVTLPPDPAGIARAALTGD